MSAKAGNVFYFSIFFFLIFDATFLTLLHLYNKYVQDKKTDQSNIHKLKNIMERREALKELAAALGGLAMIPGCKLLPGAMCYDPVAPYPKDYVCSYCNNTIKDKYDGYLLYSINLIEETVNHIKMLEYDAGLDKTEFCPKCSQKNIEKPELIFRFRFSDETEYHIARSNIISDYQCLLVFLSNPDGFTGDQTIIQKMTGLGLSDDLNIG